MESLPYEIKINILKYLSYKDIFSARLINRHWYNLSNDNMIWYEKVKNEFTPPHGKEYSFGLQKSWFDYYFNRKMMNTIYVIRDDFYEMYSCYSFTELCKDVFKRIINGGVYIANFLDEFQHDNYDKYEEIEDFVNVIKYRSNIITYESESVFVNEYYNILRTRLGKMYIIGYYDYIVNKIKTMLTRDQIILKGWTNNRRWECEIYKVEVTKNINIFNDVTDYASSLCDRHPLKK